MSNLFEKSKFSASIFTKSKFDFVPIHFFAVFIAVMYFGRKYTLSLNRKSKLLYLIDRYTERFLVPKGFQELSARVNSTNLRVSLSYATSLARITGFEVLSELVSHKNVPDGITLYGGQNGLVMKKKV